MNRVELDKERTLALVRALWARGMRKREICPVVGVTRNTLVAKFSAWGVSDEFFELPGPEPTSNSRDAVRRRRIRAEKRISVSMVDARR